MTGKKEFVSRAYNFEIRAEQDEGTYTIEGRPIVYDSMTDLHWLNEVIEKGALDEANLDDVRFLVNHDVSKIPLARAKADSDNSTMQLFVDEEGLRIVVQLDVENNTEARNLYSAIKRGDITGMSFMFTISEEEWEDLETDKPTRRIEKIDEVVEVSAVTFPAYEDTEIFARDKRNVEAMRKKLEDEKRAKNQAAKSKLDFETRTLLKMYGGI